MGVGVHQSLCYAILRPALKLKLEIILIYTLREPLIGVISNEEHEENGQI